MTPDDWRKVRGVLEQALELPPESRASFLESACSGDPELRREVDSLIASNAKARTDFLEASVFDLPSATSGEAESLAGKRIGSYQIVEEIGRGGMGSVYRAIRADDQYRKQVAIKLVRGGLGDPFRMHRFRAERQILADLDHPNIARLLDGGALDDGQPYVVMEYIDGQPIDEYCDARKLSVSERLHLFQKICSAVAYAHRRLVIHRDLKPANILVTETGEPKLLDFGIAKILDDGDSAGTKPATVTVLRPMTPEYASPEQVRGDRITTASDVYSLGVVLYGLLTGQGPYRQASRLPHEIAQAVCDVQPERPSTAIQHTSRPTTRLRPAPVWEGSPEKLSRRLRGDLDNIVLKALRKEPERRYASVEQFSEDIQRHLEGRPVVARPDTFWYRSGKFIQRNKALVASAVIVILMLITGLAITLREAYIARAERARAEKRFNDVRSLANSLVFEVHDAIVNLPGSTAARKLIVDRALRYLDALAREASGNQPLQRELAAAYQRVGDVQGGFRQANLGDTAGALASYKKALAILEGVAAADPDDMALQKELFTAHGKLSDVLMMTGDRAGSLEQSKQIIPVAERLSSSGPDGRRNLAIAYLDYGWKRADRNNWKDSLDDCRKSVVLLEAVVAANPRDRRNRRLLTLAYSRTGDLLSWYAHQHGESLAMHQKSLTVLSSLLAEDPRNTDLGHIHAWEILRTGDETSDQKAAADSFRAALGELQALSAADANDMQVQVEVAIARGRLGNSFLQQGNARAALAEFEKSLADCRRLAKPGVSNSDLTWATAFDQFQMGKAHEALASDAKQPPPMRAEQWKQAQAWYQQSIPAVQQSLNSTYGELAEDALKQAQAGLARCDQALGKSPASRR